MSWVYCPNGNINQEHQLLAYATSIEIVGNIYQNPELVMAQAPKKLTGKKKVESSTAPQNPQPEVVNKRMLGATTETPVSIDTIKGKRVAVRCETEDEIKRISGLLGYDTKYLSCHFFLSKSGCIACDERRFMSYLLAECDSYEIINSKSIVE